MEEKVSKPEEKKEISKYSTAEYWKGKYCEVCGKKLNVLEHFGEHYCSGRCWSEMYGEP